MNSRIVLLLLLCSAALSACNSPRASRTIASETAFIEGTVRDLGGEYCNYFYAKETRAAIQDQRAYETESQVAKALCSGSGNTFAPLETLYGKLEFYSHLVILSACFTELENLTGGGSPAATSLRMRATEHLNMIESAGDPSPLKGYVLKQGLANESGYLAYVKSVRGVAEDFAAKIRRGE